MSRIAQLPPRGDTAAVTVVRRAGLVAALGLLAAALALVLWPMHGNGLSGNALRPHYSSFGWYSYVAMPQHPTHEDFLRAGITMPQDVVRDRRILAAIVAATGVMLLGGVGATAALRRAR
jgi:hypothetical protein